MDLILAFDSGVGPSSSCIYIDYVTLLPTHFPIKVKYWIMKSNSDAIFSYLTAQALE